MIMVYPYNFLAFSALSYALPRLGEKAMDIMSHAGPQSLAGRIFTVINTTCDKMSPNTKAVCHCVRDNLWAATLLFMLIGSPDLVHGSVGTSLYERISVISGGLGLLTVALDIFRRTVLSKIPVFGDYFRPNWGS